MNQTPWFLFLAALSLTACGGGAGSGSKGTETPATSTPPENTATPGRTDAPQTAAPVPAPAPAPVAPSPSPAAPIAAGYSPATSHSNSFCADGQYPAQWEWRPDAVSAAPAPATSGTPLIKHIRNGQVIATYSQFSGYRSAPNNVDAHDASVGPFRRMPYTQMMDGDLFEVYPAVYEGEYQQIFIGPNVKNDAAYTAGLYDTPKNITIRGITVDGRRPVIKNPPSGASSNNLNQALIYVGTSENVTIENIEVMDASTGGPLGKAGIYLSGAKNLTLKNVRVSGFRRHQQNGIFGTSSNSGTLLMQGVELDDNGGSNGPEHNIYMNASATDSNFTVKMQNSWSHGSYYGHLFKSRAQVNILEGNYFQGTKSTGSQTETYLVDIPEGGTLVARNNIFAKNFSGDMSNGAAITFAVEVGNSTKPFDPNRPWALNVEHNTFVAFSRYYDTQGHKLFPFFFKSSAPVPPAAYGVRNNLFVGYCPSAPVPASYYGEGHVEAGFNDIDLAFRPRNPSFITGSGIVGTPGYAHKLGLQARTTTAAGARD